MQVVIISEIVRSSIIGGGDPEQSIIGAVVQGPAESDDAFSARVEATVAALEAEVYPEVGSFGMGGQPCHGDIRTEWTQAIGN